jgi:hypothetical protein
MLPIPIILKTLPFLIGWFFRRKIPSMFMAVVALVTGNKKIAGYLLLVLLIAGGLGANYFYIKHLQSNIVKLEQTLEKRNSYIDILIADILMQNEAIDEMRKTQERLAKEARERLEAVLEQQKKVEIKEARTVEELNQWLNSLR